MDGRSGGVTVAQKNKSPYNLSERIGVCLFRCSQVQVTL